MFEFFNKLNTARSHSLVVKGENFQPGGCGFESRRRILDEMIAKLQ